MAMPQTIEAVRHADDPLRGLAQLIDAAISLAAREHNLLTAAHRAGSLTPDISTSLYEALSGLARRGQQAGVVRADYSERLLLNQADGERRFAERIPDDTAQPIAIATRFDLCTLKDDVDASPVAGQFCSQDPHRGAVEAAQPVIARCREEHDLAAENRQPHDSPLIVLSHPVSLDRHCGQRQTRAGGYGYGESERQGRPSAHRNRRPQRVRQVDPRRCTCLSDRC